MVGGIGSSPLIINDAKSALRFLVDTGARVSILPTVRSERLSRKTGPSLVAANGSESKSYGFRTEILHIGTMTYDCRFVIADVSRPILDFLLRHGLLVDTCGWRLLNASSCRTAVVTGRDFRSWSWSHDMQLHAVEKHPHIRYTQ